MIGESLPDVPLTLPVFHGVDLEGLPSGWAGMSPEDQRDFLVDARPLLPTETFVGAGLEVGARRLESQRSEADPISHVQVLAGQIGSRAARDAFVLGQNDNGRS